MLKKKLRKVSLGILTSLFIAGAPATHASASGLENFLSKSQQFWQKGLAEFVEDADLHIKPADLDPVVVSKLEFFTQIANSYQIPVEELQKAYSTAAFKTAEMCLKNLQEIVAADRRPSDGDVAFLMEDLTGYLKFWYGDYVRSCAAKNGRRELEKALRECETLRISPMIDAFLKSGECKQLLRELPYDVESVVFSQMKNREKTLVNNPHLTAEPLLRYILVELKRYGLIGG